MYKSAHSFQSVDKACLLNELMYINGKYTSAHFYVILIGKEDYIFYEFDKSRFFE